MQAQMLLASTLLLGYITGRPAVFHMLRFASEWKCFKTMISIITLEVPGECSCVIEWFCDVWAFVYYLICSRACCDEKSWCGCGSLFCRNKPSPYCTQTTWSYSWLCSFRVRCCCLPFGKNYRAVNELQIIPADRCSKLVWSSHTLLN